MNNMDMDMTNLDISNYLKNTTIGGNNNSTHYICIIVIVLLIYLLYTHTYPNSSKKKYNQYPQYHHSTLY